MGLCFSAANTAEGDSHHGGNDMSKSSSKVSSDTVPSTTQTNGQILESPNWKSFGFSELKEATSNFRPGSMLGNFGSVFKGWIDEHSLKPSRPDTGMAISVKPPGPDTGMPVAVKRLRDNRGQQEWLSEIIYMGQLLHPNLVKLIGYCLEDDHRLLVYEFVPNGSLENRLLGRDSHIQPLSWNLRMKIALGAAKCLAFLHDKADVIHRDFRSSNILLDSDYNAKLCDLGLAKDGPIGKSHVTTRVMGGYGQGYAAPEYIRAGHISKKSDIYSFGVVLLEMLSGRRAIEWNRQSGQRHLGTWARSITDRRKISQILNPAILGEHSGSSALKVAQLAYECVSGEPKFRPDIKDVVKILENLQDNTVCKSSNGSKQ